MIKKLLPNIFRIAYWRRIVQELSLAWRLVRDPRVPLLLKVIPALVALYLIVPVDLIPGWLPVIGQLDDLAVLALGMGLFTRLAPKDVVADYERMYAGRYR